MHFSVVFFLFKRSSSFITHGYKTRRMAVEHAIPLVTDVKCAKLLIKVRSLLALCIFVQMFVAMIMWCCGFV